MSDWIHIVIPRPDPAKTAMYINGVEAGEYRRRQGLPRRPLTREDVSAEQAAELAHLLANLTVNEEGYVYHDGSEVGRINEEGGVSRVHWYRG